MARVLHDASGDWLVTAHRIVAAESGAKVLDVAPLDDLRGAEFSREGADLVITGEDGSVVVVEGYFLLDSPPALAGTDGGFFSPDLILSFLTPAHPGQYAGPVAESDPVGVVREISGNATVTRADGTTEPLTQGADIYKGDIVETDAEGAVDIVFVDKTSFAVTSNARLAIDEYVYDPETGSGKTDVSVLRGMFVFTSGLIGQSDPDDVHIQTPVGSIGIRGTMVAGNADTGEYTVIEGAIVLRAPNGQEMTLSGQYETARFDAAGGIQNMGTVSPDALQAGFANLGRIAPGFFSAMSGGAQGQDAGAEGTPGGEADNAREDGGGQNSDPGRDEGNQGEGNQGEGGQTGGTADEAAPDGGGETSLDGVPESDGTASPADAPAQTEGTALPLPPPTGSNSFTGTVSVSSSAGLTATSPAGTPSTSPSAPAGSGGGTAAGTGILSPSPAPAPTPTSADTNPPPPAPPPALPPPAPFALTINRTVVDDDLQTGATIATIRTTENFPSVSYALQDNLGGRIALVPGAGDLAAITLLSGALTDGEILTIAVSATLPDGRHQSGSFAITVSDINDAPVAADATFNIDENAAAASAVGAVSASDPDAGQTLTYAITAGNTGGAFSIDAATGAIVTAGALDYESIAQYVLTVTVTDSGFGPYSDTATITIDINDLPDIAPTLDLDLNDSSGAAGNGYQVSWTEGTAVVVMDTDVSILDADDANMQSATVTLNSAPDGAGVEYLFVTGGDQTVSGVTITGSGTGSISLSGSATLAVYQAVLKMIKYDNLSDNPATANRTVDVVVSDGTNASAAAQAVISIIPVDDSDTLAGTSGNDTISGDGGNDTFLSSLGDDTMSGGAGDDTFEVQDNDGNDTLDGGAGTDTYNAASMTASLTFDFAADLVTDGTYTDSFTGIEQFIGGGGGSDALDFSAAGGAVDVDLLAGQIYDDGSARSFTVSGIENIFGSGFADILDGGAGGNQIHGGAGDDDIADDGGGNDSLYGESGDDILAGGAGNDLLDGGTGGESFGDTADYSFAAGAVTAVLGTGASVDGDGGTDTFSSIENLIGSDFGDTLEMDGTGGLVTGGLGADTLLVSGSFTEAYGEDDNDTLTISLSAGLGNVLYGGDGNDVLSYQDDTGSSELFRLYGDDGDDTLIIYDFDDPDAVAEGGAGDDVLILSGGTTLWDLDGTQFGTYGQGISGFETIDAQDSLSENITLTFDSNMMTDVIGGFMTIRVDNSDLLTLDLSFAGGFVNGSTDGSTFIEYTDGSFTVRVETQSTLANVIVMGASFLLDLNAIESGANTADGVAVVKTSAQEFGAGVAGLGRDANGDGYDDVAIVQGVDTGAGSGFIYRGGATGTVLPTSGASGLGLTGGPYTDLVVSGAGDFNGDGKADYIVGAPTAADADGTPSGTGNVQIMFGSGAGGAAAGVELIGLSAGQLAGASVAGIGDVNRDGHDDVLVGAPGTTGSAGAAYILFGDDYNPGSAIDVTSMNSPRYEGGDGIGGLGTSATDIEFAATGSGPYVYIARNNNTIKVYNVDDPSAPVQPGTGSPVDNALVTGLGGYTGDPDALTGGVDDIMIRGPYLYILSGATTTGGQITVLNISNPASPVFVDSFANAALAGATSMDITGDGKLLVSVDNGGTGKALWLDVNAGGNILSIHGSPVSHASLAGSIASVVLGSYGYVATTAGLRVVNMTATSPTLGTSIGASNLRSLHVDSTEQRLYSIATDGTLRIYDIASGGNDASPVQIGTYSGGTLSGATDISVYGGMAYVTTAAGVIQLDVHIPASITLVGNIGSGITADDQATALTIDHDGFLHVVSGGSTNSFNTYDIVPEGKTYSGGGSEALGGTVAAAGDLDGDGAMDFLIAAPTAGGGASAGTVYAVFGGRGIENSSLIASAVRITGIDVDTTPGERTIEISYAGDMNGQGLSDFVIGEDGGTSSGVYFFFGENLGAAGSSVDVSTADFKILEFGSDRIVGGGFAGDFNGDGYDDFTVAVDQDSGSGRIDLYVVYGGNSLPSLMDTSQFNDTNSFHMRYTVQAVFASDPALEITAAGDIDGDGFGDILIGVPNEDNAPGVNSDGSGGLTDDRDGSALVVYGRESDSVTYGFATPNVTATAADDSLIGGAANNTLDDGGYTGLFMSGGTGNDIFRISNGGFQAIDGGGNAAGSDRIDVVGGSLDFSALITRETVSRIEEISMTGSGQTITLSLDNIFGLLSTSDTGTLKLTSSVTSNTLVIDNQGAGAQNAVATGDDLAKLIGADGWGDNAGQSAFEFTYGDKSLLIGYNLFDAAGNLNVDVA